MQRLGFSAGESIDLKLNFLLESGHWRLGGSPSRCRRPPSRLPLEALNARGEEFFARWNDATGKDADDELERVRSVHGQVLTFETESLSWKGHDQVKARYEVVLEKGSGSVEVAYGRCGNLWPVAGYTTDISLTKR